MIAKIVYAVEWCLAFAVAWMVGASWVQGGTTPQQRQLLGAMVLALLVLIAARRLRAVLR